MALSVIIPTLNEAENIGSTVSSVRRSGATEVIVVDGGSTDATVARAREAGAVVFASASGRGTQQKLGAERAQCPTLLFLHADTQLPAEFPLIVGQVLDQPQVAAGAFRFKLDEDSWGLRCIERIVDWRSRWFELPYGDQAIFVRAETLKNAGGFPDLPIMEDYELVRRLRRLGRIRIADSDAVTSARRWRRLGVIGATCSNVACLVAYKFGAAPETIAAWRRA